MNFRERVTEDENIEQGWIKGLPNWDEYLTDAYIPLQPQSFEQLESQEKEGEYRNYQMKDVKRLWYMNTESCFITHMTEVSREYCIMINKSMVPPNEN
jgi:hypothetical protein